MIPREKKPETFNDVVKLYVSCIKELIGKIKSKHIFIRGANRGNTNYCIWENPETLKLYIELFITKNKNNYYMISKDIIHICKIEKPKNHDEFLDIEQPTITQPIEDIEQPTITQPIEYTGLISVEINRLTK